MSPSTVGRPSELENEGDSPGSRSAYKSVLFCPKCGHESPVDGDWTVTGKSERGAERTDAELVYECPNCDCVVTVRPDYDHE